MNLVLRRGIAICLLVVTAGLVVAWILSPTLVNFLYCVKLVDPHTCSMAGVGMLLLSLAACYIPARRATETDPIVTLRYE